MKDRRNGVRSIESPAHRYRTNALVQVSTARKRVVVESECSIHFHDTQSGIETWWRAVGAEAPEVWMAGASLNILWLDSAFLFQEGFAFFSETVGNEGK